MEEEVTRFEKSIDISDANDRVETYLNGKAHEIIADALKIGDENVEEKIGQLINDGLLDYEMTVMLHLEIRQKV